MPVDINISALIENLETTNIFLVHWLSKSPKAVADICLRYLPHALYEHFISLGKFSLL
jgi:hypothetical protein